MQVLISALGLLFGFLETLIIIDVILSWVYKGDNSLVRLIHVFTEPLLLPGKKLQEKIIPGIPVDFSPIIAFAILRFLESIASSLA
jgi:YggT family protein